MTAEIRNCPNLCPFFLEWSASKDCAAFAAAAVVVVVAVVAVGNTMVAEAAQTSNAAVVVAEATAVDVEASETDEPLNQLAGEFPSTDSESSDFSAETKSQNSVTIQQQTI